MSVSGKKGLVEGVGPTIGGFGLEVDWLERAHAGALAATPLLMGASEQASMTFVDRARFWALRDLRARRGGMCRSSFVRFCAAPVISVRRPGPGVAAAAPSWPRGMSQAVATCQPHAAVTRRLRRAGPAVPRSGWGTS